MTQQTLFAAGQGGYTAYRIPTVLTLASGRVLAFCEGRRDSLGDAGNIDIVMRSGDGACFEAPRVIVSGGGDTVGNPSPVQDPATGRVHLLYNDNAADASEHLILQGRGERRCFVIYSDDEGESWSSPREITQQVKQADWTWYAFGPCHGIVLPSGRLMLGANHAVLDKENGCSGPYHSHVVYSDDHGESWHLGETMGAGTNECALAAFENGEVLINMRYIPFGGAENPFCRAQARALDGVHFSQTQLVPELTDPVCQGSLLTVQTERGEELLFSNACAQKREKLTIQRSNDHGHSFEIERCLTEGSSAYADMTQLPDGRIAVLAEVGGETAYERLDMYVFELK